MLYKRKLTPELTALVRSISRAVESRLAEHEKTLQYSLRERFLKRTAGHRTPALAVDRNGLIVAEHGGASSILGLNSKACGKLVNDIPALNRTLGSRNSHCPATELSPGQKQLTAIESVFDRDEPLGTLIFLSEPASSRAGGHISTWTSQFHFTELVGESESLESALDVARKIAVTDFPVLLTGETGTGKELVAHAIHNASERRWGPFVPVNCASIPQELITSELLGYARGAFTGARASGMHGKFMQANGGTIFLDEITEMSPALQAVLLRVVQDHAVVPIASDRPFEVDVRVIAATNRQISDCLTEGTFRQDLYFRLSAVLINLPPLRDRMEDLELLVERFLRGEGRGKTISADALALLRLYQWPGNVRELKNAMQTAAAIADGEMIDIEHLPLAIRNNSHLANVEKPPALGSMRQIEAEAIRKALKLCRGNVAQAASLLGIGRSSLYRKLQQLD